MDKDKKIEILQQELEKYKKSPYHSAYLALYMTIERWNKDLKENHFSILATDDSDIKAFDKAHKASLSMKDLYEQLDFFRTKITPIELEEVQKTATSLLEKALQSDGQIE